MHISNFPEDNKIPFHRLLFVVCEPSSYIQEAIDNIAPGIQGLDYEAIGEGWNIGRHPIGMAPDMGKLYWAWMF